MEKTSPLSLCLSEDPTIRYTPEGKKTKAWKLPPWHCNRTMGHPGPHRVYDGKTFAIRSEW